MALPSRRQTFAMLRVSLIFALATTGTLLFSGCTKSPLPSVSFADIHGLAVDPNDPSILYVATHHGLFKGVNDQEWSKVSQETMDLMGFTMHPTQPDVMYASGHPARPSRDYNSLGVVKSVDGGITWTTVALKNEVDFHAMTISLADPGKVWGWYYRDSNFYEAPDAGLTWNHWAPTNPPKTIYAIASGADEASTVYAASADGLYVSRDAGHSWQPLQGKPPPGGASVIATTKADPQKLWAFFPSAGFAQSSDMGKNWTLAAHVAWESQDGPAAIAIDPSDPGTVYAASGRGAIYKTIDDGGSWSLVRPAGATNAY